MAFLSSYIDNEKALKPGDKAPTIELATNSKEILEKGKIKIINFWSPKNPSSRIANQKISKYLKENPDSESIFISICTDSDDNLAKEVLKWDGIYDEGNHLFYSDVNSKVFKDFKTNGSHHTFAIASDGKILKVN